MPQENLYLSLVTDDTANQVRQSMSVAVDRQPDTEAKLQGLANQYGIPVEAVRLEQPNVERRAKLDALDYRTLAEQYPSTANFLADPAKASIAHDDTDNLSLVEKTLGVIKNSGSALYSAIPSTAAGLYGLARAGTETFIQPVTGLLAGRILPEDIGGRMADTFGRLQREQQAIAKARTPQSDSVVGSGFYSGVQSFGQNMLTLPLALLPGGQAAALTAMVAPVGGDAYGQARDKGTPVATSLGFGASQALIEYATEKLPLNRLIGDVKAGTPLFKTLLHNAALEIPGEQLATVLQDMNEWAVLHPEKPFADYLKERPSAAAQTLIATLVGTGGQVTVAHGLDSAAARITGRTREAERAEQDAQALQQLHDLATASKLRARDPASFQQFVAQAMEDGPVADVYINAATLAQSGVDIAAIAAASPAVATQLQDAIATGGDIRIPVEEFAATIAGTEYAQSLIPHLKTDPAGMTQAEAQVYMQNQADELRAEVERALAGKQQDDSFKASRDEVAMQMLDQLNKAGRFTEDVNRSYANMIANFYAVMGAKVGITPAEMAQRYPLQVRAERLAGAKTLDQTRPEFLPLDLDKPLAAQPYEVRHRIRNEIKRLRAEAWNAEHTNDPEKEDERITGRQLLEIITDRLGSEQDARDYLASLGVELPAAEYGQPQAGGKRGSITLGDDITQTPSVITLLQNADLSTFLHESGHFYLEVLTDLASREGAPQQIKDDMAAVLKWFGIEDKRSPERIKLESITQAISYEDAKALVAGKTEKPGGTDPLKQIEAGEGNRAAYRIGDVPLSMFMENQDGALYDGTVDPARAADYQARTTEAPPVIAVLSRRTGKLNILDGGHRITAARARGDASIKVIVSLKAEQSPLDVWNSYDIEQKREHHEQFARGFEAYLFEGRAPSVELAGMFQRFRAWLLNVYQSLKSLNVELTDEVRGVFDRMLASSEAIKEAEAARGYTGLFDTKPDFMSDEQWLNYQALGHDATQEAVHSLEHKSLRDMQWLSNAKSKLLGKLQTEARDKRKAVRREVEAEVMAEPVNQARRFLKRGELTTESGDQIQTERGHKLDIEAVKEMYPESALNSPDWQKLGYGGFGMLGKDGLHPDMVAEMFGFTSGDQLIRELLAAENPRDKIEGITDQRMLERHGDLVDAKSIERAADEALHNEARLRFVATELKALEDAMNVRSDTGRTNAKGQRITVATLPRAARQFAEATIARLKVRDLRPSQYASAAARAAKNADAAFKKGDIQTAAVEKRNQLVNSYADRAAHAAQGEVDKAIDYFKKFEREGTRKALDLDYLEQIDALLARFDLRKGQSLKAIDRRKSLAEWAEAQREMGVEPDLPPELLNEAVRKSFKDMTVEEVRGLRDAIKQIEHLARLKHKLLTAKDQREFEAIRDDIAQSINDNAGDRTADTRTATTNLGRTVQGLKRFWASHIKAATWARVFDGGKDGGQFWNYIVRSANEAGDRETTMRADATKALSDILAPVFKLGKMGGKGMYFPTIDRSLNREARITIALNTGNASNLQRLLGGEGWTAAQVQPVLDSLTMEEWKAVQAVWDHFESYRPMIEAKEKRVYGKAPEWLEATPVTITRDGQTVELRGGYYPVKYDPAASQRAEEHADAEGAKRQLQGAYTSATTRRSFTKSRADEVVGRPLLYSLAGLYSGVNDVIHDLSWHEWLIDVNRLLRSNSIDSAIRNHYGPEAKAQFKTWVADIAEGEKGAANQGEAALGKLRQNVSVAGLGFNVVSAAMQGLGLTQSIVRVGAQWVGRGITQYVASPIESTRTVNEKSDFMASRSRTRYRELNELRNKVQGELPVLDTVKEHAYVLMMRCQQMVDVPTWLGAYEKAVAGGADEAKAVSMADQAVMDAQGGGQTKDLAAIERGGQAMRLFTVFYSFMNTALNIGVAQTMTSNSKAKLAADYLLLYTVPAVLGFALKNALTPGDSGDDDDLGKLALKLVAEQIGYLMGLIVVGREFAEAGKALLPTGDKHRDYGGPAGVRLIGDTYNFGKQAAQGEFDDAFRKAAVNLTGDLLGLPSAQINRTITGAKALSEGKTENPAALAFGFQERR